jgi:glycerol kinase
MAHVLALDQGTSSSRALVLDEAGQVAGSAQQEFEQLFPRPGWVEHSPEAIWDSQLATAHQAVARAGLSPADIGAVGITNQRETVVVWDRRTGQPIHNAIVWQDRRTAPMLADLRRAGHEPMVRDRTGLLLDPYFSASKLRWLLDHVPGARERARAGELAAGTIDSWLVHKLTDGRRHVTDVSNASRTLLMNLHTGAWDGELLRLFDVPREILPEIVPSSAVVAETAGPILGRALPIAGIAGDQQAALFGQECRHPGLAKNTYGTGCFLLMHTGQQAIASRRLLTTVAWRLGDRPLEYALEGSIFVAGAAIQWLRDGLGVIRSAAEVNALASTVPDAGGVWLVPAFAGLGAPHWDPTARGTIVGLTRGTTAAHLARAALEAIACQVAEVVEAMERDAGIRLTALRVDGGASASDLLMQLQADLLGVPVERPVLTESTALGAAALAGLGAGVWRDEGRAGRTIDRTFTPSITAQARAARLAGWRRAVERARGWVEGAEIP